MNQGFLRWVGIVAVAIAVGTAPVSAEAGPSTDNLLELAAKDGPSVGFGLGVSPLHWELLPVPEAIPGSMATESRPFWDRDARGKAVSFDITLKWPTEKLPIEPYVFIGPALLVDQPQELSNPTAVPADSVFRLGAKAGAGFTWRLSKEATFFGSYDVTTGAVDGVTASGAKAPGTSAPIGYDLLYGVRFRY